MEPLDILYRAAMERTRPMVDELRRAGWDVQIMLNAPTSAKVVLALEIHLEMARVPIDAAIGGAT